MPIGITILLQICAAGKAGLSLTWSETQQYILPVTRLILLCFRNLFPDNLFEATFRKSQTMTKPIDKTNSTNTSAEEAAAEEVKKYVATVDGTNLLGETQNIKKTRN